MNCFFLNERENSNQCKQEAGSYMGSGPERRTAAASVEDTTAGDIEDNTPLLLRIRNPLLLRRGHATMKSRVGVNHPQVIDASHLWVVDAIVLGNCTPVDVAGGELAWQTRHVLVEWAVFVKTVPSDQIANEGNRRV